MKSFSKYCLFFFISNLVCHATEPNDYLKNENLASFLNYTNGVFTKDSIAIYRPNEPKLMLPLLKDQYGYKAVLKGVFEYREEILRKDGYYTGRVFVKVFTDYRFRIEIEHIYQNIDKKSIQIFPGFSTNKPSNFVQTRADRCSHPGVIVLQKNQVFMIGCQEKPMGTDTIFRNYHHQPNVLYNGIFSYNHQNINKIGFSIGYKHKPFDTLSTPDDSTFAESWIERKMGKVLSFKTFYFIENTPQGLANHEKAIRTYYKEFHENNNRIPERQDKLKFLRNYITTHYWNGEKSVFQDKNEPINENLAISIAMSQLKSSLFFNDSLGVKKYTKYLYNTLINNNLNNVELQTIYHLLKIHDEISFEENGKYVSDLLLQKAKARIENHPNITEIVFALNMAKLAYILKNETYLKLADKTVLSYFKKIHSKTFLIDNNVPQSEIIAFIKSCYELHKLTHQTQYIEMATEAFSLLCLHTFCYNSISSNSPMRNINFQTTGGNISNSKYSYLDINSIQIISEMNYFYLLTKDNYILKRLQDITRFAISSINIGEKKMQNIPEGFVTNQFYQSDYSKENQNWDGGISEKNDLDAAVFLLFNLSNQLSEEIFR